MIYKKVNFGENAGWVVMMVSFLLIELLVINTIGSSLIPSANAAIPSQRFRQPSKSLKKNEIETSHTNDLSGLSRNKREPQYYGEQFNNPNGYQQTRKFGGGALNAAGRVALTYAGNQVVSAAGNEVIDRNGLLDTNTHENNHAGFVIGGTAAGAAIGAGVGSVAFGVGAAPGAAVGAVLGSAITYFGAKIMD